MDTSTTSRSLTIRLPRDVYAEAQSVAKRRNTSLNTLLREGLAIRLREEEFAELYAAFGEVGREEDCDVEFALHAQAEVVLREE